MPMNLGFFFIRKPRVSQYNAVSTRPPTSQGTFILKNCFRVSYIGVGAYSALLSITGKKILTIVDETLNHVDNLNIEVIGRNITELVEEINKNSNYLAEIITNTPEDLCLLEGTIRTDINNVYHTVRYNREIEYLIDTHKEGKLGNCSVAYKEEGFIYSGENSRWMIDEGFIYDKTNVLVPTTGVVDLGNLGVKIKFFPSINLEDNDINRTVSFQNLQLVQSLDSPISETTFSAAPILVDNTLELKINQQVKQENVDYIVDYGTPAELRTINPSPYIFNSSNNIFRVRHNSFPIQEFVFPLGEVTAKQLADFVNTEANGYKAYAYLDTETKLEYFSIIADRGTFYHQIRIEEGSANPILGYTDMLSAKGESNGKLLFMTYVQSEDITPLERTSSLSVKAIETATDNPFLGVYTKTFSLKENNVDLIKGENFLVNDNGNIQLVENISEENLISGILTEDLTLFPDSYNVYDNGVKLESGVDYKINPQGGWITLSTSAFPGHVYTADYKHKSLGEIKGEVLLGTQAVIESTLKAPYSIPLNKYNLKISVNNGEVQSFNVPTGNGIVIEDVISTINATATGFEAYQSKLNVLSVRTLKYGPENSITILDGTLNEIVGFENFYSATGSGAKGGEQSLETKNRPMEIGGFTAPEGGNTIVIKNNDVTSRYRPGAMIKLLNDFYQIKESYVENRANIINTVAEPYTIIENSNNILKFTIDNNSETTVTFSSGKDITVDFLVEQINNILPNAAKVIFINGIKRIQFFGNTLVKIGNGTINRTLGLEANQVDTNVPDTFIVVNSPFKTVYVNPKMFTTIDEVIFKNESSEKLEAPQNVNEVVFKGNVSGRYQPNIILRLNNTFYYTVKSSLFDEDDDETTVTLTSKTDIPIYKDTDVSFTDNPILLEGSNRLKTNFYPVLSEPFSIYKNDSLLKFETDYEISDMGDIELVQGLLNGDRVYINYFGKRFIEANTSVVAKYSFFDFLRKGSNIKISYLADFPDNFYLNVIHASTLMNAFQKEASDKIQQTANSSSSGFPTGEIPVSTNAESGNGSFEYDIGDYDDKIVLTNTWYYFFDNRIKYFEEEKRLLKGFRIGAEDGRLTQSQIEDSANNPPTRLFPLPDTRPEEERSEPKKLPCLFGENKNDAGSDSHGWYSEHIFSKLNEELTKCNDEKTKLNQLLAKSISSGSTASTGNFDIYGSEQMQLYIERNSGGSLIQTNHTITFTEKFDTTSGGGGGCILDSGPITTHRANTAAEIANAINSQVGIGVASYSGGTVYLNANTSVPCVFVVSDAPHVGFGNNADASIRSRSPWWTGGYTYNITVPGSYSVHLDITNQNSVRSNNNSKHTEQIQNLNGIMEEWLPPLDASFNPAKLERNNCQSWISSANSYSSQSTTFDNLKSFSNGQIFTSINNNSVLTDRISVINTRISLINSRVSQVNNRYTGIENDLQRESLFNQRYSWLMILTHRNNGYYADKKRAIDDQNKSLREAENSSAALDSMDTFG